MFSLAQNGVLAKMIEREGWQSEQKDHALKARTGQIEEVLTEHVSLAKSIEERLFDVEIFLKEFPRAAAGKEF
jgi:hypothetical protein